jgi:hypothetical protein
VERGARRGDLTLKSSKKAESAQNTARQTTWIRTLGWLAAWAWTIVAAGGGGWLLWTKGPWPLTNGWFALLSGISACPATAWLLEKGSGVTVSGHVRLAAAIFFFVTGRIALALGI